MKTRTMTLAVLWIMLDAMLSYTDLEEKPGEASSCKEAEVGTGLVTASGLRGRSPPWSSPTTVYEPEEAQR